VDIGELVGATEMFTPADIEVAARKGAQFAFEREIEFRHRRALARGAESNRRALARGAESNRRALARGAESNRRALARGAESNRRALARGAGGNGERAQTEDCLTAIAQTRPTLTEAALAEFDEDIALRTRL